MQKYFASTRTNQKFHNFLLFLSNSYHFYKTESTPFVLNIENLNKNDYYYAFDYYSSNRFSTSFTSISPSFSIWFDHFMYLKWNQNQNKYHFRYLSRYIEHSNLIIQALTMS